MYMLFKRTWLFTFFILVRNMIADTEDLTTGTSEDAYMCDDDDSVALLQNKAQLAARQDSNLRHSRTSPIAGCEGFECIEQYVNLPDSSYHWEDTGVRLSGVGSYEFDKPNAPAVPWIGYVLNMTSHTWPNNVSNPVWWHTLVVIDPSNREIDDLATLVLDFGWEDRDTGSKIKINNRITRYQDRDEWMSLNKEDLKESLGSLKHAVQKAVYLATRTKARTASLLNCPNAYEVFGDDKLNVHRSQDVLKGYTYGDFLEHPSEPERIMELPVAKSVVRALDTITAFSKDSISRFGVIGYSKLATATWIAGALDDRVQVLAPTAIYLNFANTVGKHPPLTLEQYEKGLEEARYTFHHTRTHPYVLAMFHAIAQTPEWEKLHKIIDPSAWLSRVAKPKFYVMSSSDTMCRLKVKDEAELMLPAMPGLTRFLELPNTPHFMSLVDALPMATAFFRGFLLEMSPPEISYTLNRSAHTILARQVSSHYPVEVKMWHQVDKLKWVGSLVEETYFGSGLWLAKGDPAESHDPSVGGIFIQFTYDWPEPGFEFKTSSPVMSYTPVMLFQPG